MSNGMDLSDRFDSFIVIDVSAGNGGDMPDRFRDLYARFGISEPDNHIYELMDLLEAIADRLDEDV